MSSDPIYIFFHLSKSGGTTLGAHFARHLEWDVEFVNFSNWGINYRNANDLPEFKDRPLEDRQAARVLSGHTTSASLHALVPGREPRYFTVVRDPAERCVSIYNFRRSRGTTDLPFEEWYREVYLPHYANSAVRFYAGKVFGEYVSDDAEANIAIALKLLERCWLVTVTQNLGMVLDRLSAELAIPNDWTAQRSADNPTTLNLPHHPSNGEVVTRYVSVDDRIREWVANDSAYDVSLYEWAKKQPL